MADVTLTAAMRSNLLSLQQTASLQDRTQLRLSTGKAVNSVLDDAVKFFTADALNQRSSLLLERKADISNAVQSVTAATNGVDAIKTSIQQLKSLVSQARSALNSAAGDTTRASIATQYNEVLAQIDNLAQDASYNGVNFLQRDSAGSLTDLTVYFNEESTTSLTIQGFDASASGLGVAGGAAPTATLASGATQSVVLAPGNSVSLSTAGIASVSLGGLTIGRTAAGALTVTQQDGSTQTIAAGEAFSGTYTASSGSVGITKGVNDAVTLVYSDDGSTADEAGEVTVTLASDDSATVVLESGTTAADDSYALTGTTAAGSSTVGATPITAYFSTSTFAADSFDSVGELNALDSALNAALATLQAESGKLSGNVSILQTRDNFLKELANTLTTGADKLTLADVNEEGANLLALQTRQQLGITSLSLASQALQGVLRLF